MPGDEQKLLQQQLSLLGELETVARSVADNQRLAGLFAHILDREAHDITAMRNNTEQRLALVRQKRRRKQKYS